MDNMIQLMSEQNQMNLIRKTNEYTKEYGLSLTEQDVQQLVVKRRECLREQQRVEFGGGILDKLIFAFCDSDYIFQENYAETITRLQDIFYLYKNESMDEWTDDELIQIMRKAFDGECQGSLEYLEETFLEQFARNTRANTCKFIGRYEDDESRCY